MARRQTAQLDLELAEDPPMEPPQTPTPLRRRDGIIALSDFVLELVEAGLYRSRCDGERILVSDKRKLQLKLWRAFSSRDLHAIECHIGRNRFQEGMDQALRVIGIFEPGSDLLCPFFLLLESIDLLPRGTCRLLIHGDLGRSLPNPAFQI